MESLTSVPLPFQESQATEGKQQEQEEEEETARLRAALAEAIAELEACRLERDNILQGFLRLKAKYRALKYRPVATPISSSYVPPAPTTTTSTTTTTTTQLAQAKQSGYSSFSSSPSKAAFAAASLPTTTSARGGGFLRQGSNSSIRRLVVDPRAPLSPPASDRNVTPTAPAGSGSAVASIATAPAATTPNKQASATSANTPTRPGRRLLAELLETSASAALTAADASSGGSQARAAPVVFVKAKKKRSEESEAALFEFDEPRLATELDTTPFVEGIDDSGISQNGRQEQQQQEQPEEMAVYGTSLPVVIPPRRAVVEKEDKAKSPENHSEEVLETPDEETFIAPHIYSLRTTSVFDDLPRSSYWTHAG